VVTVPETLHVCYCHNTTRYAWMYHEYVAHEGLGVLERAVLPTLVSRLRTWDYAAAQRPDHYVANSRTTARRIAKYYRRQSIIIEPPIRTAEFAGGSGRIEPYFLIVSRLQSYKRLDLAIVAANRLGIPLRIIGRGPDEARLRALAGPTVEFLGRISDEERVCLLQRCSALLVPGREDFGMVSLEAQAAGRPVVAFGAGGSLETVIESKTGAFFQEQTVECLQQALHAFDPGAYDGEECRANARRFDVSRFSARLRSYLETLLAAHHESLR
jgi:glycosyltransferase involved in cell wall biosynthesis